MIERQLTLCTLGLLSDKTVYPQVMQVFLEIEDGYFRALAARALGKIKNKAAIPSLKRALKDGFHVTYTTDVRLNPHHPNRRTIYPVRGAAAAALRVLGVQVTRQGHDFRVVE